MVILPLAIVTGPSLLGQPPGQPTPQHGLGCFWAETVGGVFPPGPSCSPPTPSLLVLEATESLRPQLVISLVPSPSLAFAPELSLLEATQRLAEQKSVASLSDIRTGGCRREAKSKA